MSRDWTPEELQAASEAMKAAGHMSYEEFCANLVQQGMKPAPTKKVWGRIGITFDLTAEEFQTLSAGGDDAKELVFQKMKNGDYLLDGDTYFPPVEGENYWQFRYDIEIPM